MRNACSGISDTRGRYPPETSEQTMSMNLTKLSNAEYPLRDAREAIDGDNALNPADPTAYYTATGNPPGYWIGKGAELVGGKVGTTASSKTVRTLINERRNPSNGQYLGDVKLVEGDNGEAPVAGFDLTTRQPKSISILWAFGDTGRSTRPRTGWSTRRPPSTATCPGTRSPWTCTTRRSRTRPARASCRWC